MNLSSVVASSEYQNVMNDLPKSGHKIENVNFGTNVDCVAVIDENLRVYIRSKT